jgi:hypothetical protein
VQGSPPEANLAEAAAKPEAAEHIAGAAPPEKLSCPICLTPMEEVSRNARAVYRCASCRGEWSESATQPDLSKGLDQPVQDVVPAEAAAGVSQAGLVSSLLYGMSLPERIVRGAVGLTAGAARELAVVLVPQAFQDSTSYKIAIENSLGFLTETVGGVPGQTGATADAAEAGEHLARKAVGNFVDLAGLAMLHVSPMWMLAVVSDVAYGTKSYTLELAKELEAQGVIDNASTIHNVDDILTAVQRTCGSAASTFDRPPFSINELRRTIDETRQSLSQADIRRLIPESELRNYWEEMRTISREENVSLLGVSGAVAMQTLNRVTTVGHGALVGVQVAGGILNRTVVSHYRDALTRIHQKGFYESVSESYGPYVTAVWSNFSREKKSWTESLLDPGNVSKLVGAASGWLRWGTKAEAPAVPETPAT